MSDTITDAPAEREGASTKPRRASGLSGMVLPELQQMAGSLGISGAGKMRKAELVEAIKSAQSGSAPSSASADPAAVDPYPIADRLRRGGCRRRPGTRGRAGTRRRTRRPP